ncbi:MAG: hypothetical protein K9J17_15215 [Flavobacteriales bacterium]|nr:hypothetical protein [Flavobacteriales bacterium]
MLLTLSKRQDTNSNTVSAKEFLEWAKKDLENSDKHSIGNGIGNIKKAIHCRIDEIIDDTHIRHCEGWNKFASTDTKLEALRLLNFKFTAVVSLLTDIRNKYEHQYKLPEYREAQGFLDTAEMWLEMSYDKYSFNKLAIVGLKTTDFGVSYSNNGTKLTSCKIVKSSSLDYIWDSKKEIHEIKKGVRKIVHMNTIPWRTMAQYEAKHLVFTGTPNKTVHVLPASILTSIFRKALKELVV